MIAINKNYLAVWFEQFFGVKCSIRLVKDKIGFQIVLYYTFYQNGEPKIKEAFTYIKKEPKDWNKWMEKNQKKIAKSLSI